MNALQPPMSSGPAERAGASAEDTTHVQAAIEAWGQAQGLRLLLDLARPLCPAGCEWHGWCLSMAADSREVTAEERQLMQSWRAVPACRRVTHMLEHRLRGTAQA